MSVASARAWIYDVLERGERHPALARAVGFAISGLVLANVTGVIVQTVPGLPHEVVEILGWLDWVAVIGFASEYVLRLWACVENPRFARPLWGRVKFVFTPMALIDLLAIAPGLITLLELNLSSLRLFRVLRILRLLKLGRYSTAVRVLGRVVRQTREQLLVTLTLAILLMLVAASAMYLVEHHAQPEVFSSIPATMWWAIATLTTVGYGDVYPITPMGKFLGSVIALLGIGLFALPTGILGAAFVDEIETKRKREGTSGGTCPHCGEEL